ncbi:MAG: hypothetical protein IJY90_00200 [Clostridia bacterium]|nr:hypothetical protein [Clostridia bacterium]
MEPILKLIEKGGKHYFVDHKNNLSQPFFKAKEYENGFAMVRVDEFTGWQYRDLLGRISEKKTKSGNEFYLFCEGKLKLDEISLQYFANNVFDKGIKEVLILKAKELALSRMEDGGDISKETFKLLIEKHFNMVDAFAAMARATQKGGEEESAQRAQFEKEKRTALLERQYEFYETMEYLDSL